MVMARTQTPAGSGYQPDGRRDPFESPVLQVTTLARHAPPGHEHPEAALPASHSVRDGANPPTQRQQKDTAPKATRRSVPFSPLTPTDQTLITTVWAIMSCKVCLRS